ncbi:unnamed protein product [Anisakis simplex]|uniref:Apolipoprotein lipid transfer particle (inferred by orthology to a D. melanogaster protein) n=1 Tax=Anisakis simplex TaxID=6269 RepID=A0A0M3KC58_ANISI|nr:unnamed protein product [Anisakis simplex]
MLKVPFGVAYVIAPDRFVTFDGRVFAFHSACEYLLATDLMHQQFSLIGSFKRERAGTELDAIKVEIQKDQIVMHLNGKAEVGGREVSMPWQKVDTMDGSALVSIHREGDWTILKSYIGVEVKCNSVHHLCEIKLPGRMHAKSGGLLGCNDNEPYNDLDLIDGTHNNETNILAEHWAVQGSCRANEAPPLRSQENEKCEELFISSGSSLSDCFSQVNPQKFEQICSSDRPEHQCRAVSAFVHVCTNNGIDLSLPKPCVHCEDGLKMDEEIEVPHAGKGHDIVFVVQEKACLDPYKQNIARIAQAIGSQQRDARFGWIGYGGEGIHHSPHIHYGHDSALLDMNAFVRQTQHKFESESGFEPKPMCTLEAIKYAVEHFPFRLGAAKSIVLVTCKPCIGGSHSVSQSELQELVISHGITMHMLSLAKIKTSDKVQAVGMDADHLFSPAGSPVGDRSNVLKPSDVCSVVAQESHGTVFNIVSFLCFHILIHLNYFTNL